MHIWRVVSILVGRLVRRLDYRGVAIMADYPTTLAIVFSLSFIIGRFSSLVARVFGYVVRKRRDGVML